MKYQAFIFDLDGTLVDSALDFQALRLELGLSPNDPILESIAEWTEERRAWAHDVIHQHERRGAEVSTLMPGVAEFLTLIASRQKPVALFTRNSREVALATLQKHGLEFSLVISRDDAPAKPKPDGLHVIAETLGLSPSEILFVGDYLYDLQAGQAAQMPTALYLCEPADFDAEGAVFQFGHFDELHGFVEA